MIYSKKLILASSMLALTCSALAKDNDDVSSSHKANYQNDKMAGPGSTTDQLSEDDLVKNPAFRFASFDNALTPWFAFKADLYKDTGLQFGLAYTALYQGISNSDTANDDAASHVLRLNGKWELFNRGSKNLGYLVFSADNRHAYTDLAPNAIAGEAGYVGQTGALFNDAGAILGDLYWAQHFNDGKSAFIAGRYDPNDFFDVLGYANPWTSFQNVAILFNTSIALADWSTGIAAGHWVNDSWYIKGAINDANGVATDASFNMDLDELYKTAEFGWSPSAAQRYHTNVHVTYWESDERADAGINATSGYALGANWTWDDQIMVFGKFGVSDIEDTGFTDPRYAEQTATLGTMYQFKHRSDLLGIAVNNSKMAAEGVSDQISAEVFYRIQIAQNLAITPSYQYLRNPAGATTNKDISVVGVRLRLTL